jgi:hypothetical protein
VSRTSARPRRLTLRVDPLEDRTTPTGSPALRPGYDIFGPSFDNNLPTIAPLASPSIAVGKTQTVSVVNAWVQIQNIPNGMTASLSLQSFFGPTGPSSATVWSNQRAMYDPYADRFIVAAIGTIPTTSSSRLFIAVSDGPVPTSNLAKWFYQTPATNPTINGGATYAGYMGLGLDAQSVYVTTSQLSFATDAYQDARVLILSKTAGANGGWYTGGGTPTTSGLLDPSPAGQEARYYGLVPATMYTNPTAPPAGVGAYLVAYNGSAGTDPGSEGVEVVRVNNPTTTPTFTPTTVTVGDIDDTSTALPLAPEPHTGSNGSSLDINPGPRRLGNAVWRDGRLSFAGTVKTAAGADAAHWFQVNTTGAAPTVSRASIARCPPGASG